MFICVQSLPTKRQKKMHPKMTSAHMSVACICLPYCHISANGVDPNQSPPTGAAQIRPTSFDYLPTSVNDTASPFREGFICENSRIYRNQLLFGVCDQLDSTESDQVQMLARMLKLRMYQDIKRILILPP